MTLTEMVNNIDDVYMDIENHQKIPNDIRIEISSKLEEVMDIIDNLIEEYDDEDEDEESLDEDCDDEED